MFLLYKIALVALIDPESWIIPLVHTRDKTNIIVPESSGLLSSRLSVRKSAGQVLRL